MENDNKEDRINTSLLIMILIIVFLLTSIAFMSIRDNKQDIMELRRDLHAYEKKLDSHVEVFKHIIDGKNLKPSQNQHEE